MNCRKCDAPLQSTWVKCPTCGTSVPDVNANGTPAPRQRSPIFWATLGAIGGVLLVSTCSFSLYNPAPKPGPVNTAPASESESLADDAINAAAAAQGSTAHVRIDRFAWERNGSYCKASGKMTNISQDDLAGLEITATFLKGDEMIASDWTFIDSNNSFPAGSSSTWSQMYECPSGANRVELSAVTDGYQLQVENAVHD